MNLRILRFIVPRPASLRLGAYLSCVFGALAAVSGYSLYAQAKDAALALGAELSGLGDLTAGAELVQINGERFHHALVIVPGDPGMILDRLQAECESHPGLMGQTLHDLAGYDGGQSARAEGVAPSSASRGVVRHEADGRGMLVCWVSDERSGLSALGERLDELARTSKLSVFGRARYAFAEALPDGQSRVLTLWADTDLDLSALFPAHGDAAGSDSRLLPRPPRATRLLSAAAEGMPFLLLHYSSRAARPELQAFYDGWLGAHGWRRIPNTSTTGAAYLRQDGHQVFLGLLEQEVGTQVTVIESAGAIASVGIEG
jgi:hypothetical protein